MFPRCNFDSYEISAFVYSLENTQSLDYTLNCSESVSFYILLKFTGKEDLWARALVGLEITRQINDVTLIIQTIS
jgi:hypothetical protein